MSAWWSPQLAVGCLVGVLVLALVFVGGGGAAGVATTLVEAVDPGHLLNHLVYDIILVPVITLLTRRLFPRVHAAPMHRHHPHGD